MNGNKQLTFSQWLLFCYCWFGMNPRPFLEFPLPPLPGVKSYLIKGLSRIVSGLLIINVALKLENFFFENGLAAIFYLILLTGLSLILHFGILNISTAMLRWGGINVTSLFKDPLRSKTLNEFWSKRWNIAFVELTTIAVLRPFRKKYGVSVAFWASFVFSGFLHEMAISLPVRNGYGKPFLYFIIQAVLIKIADNHLLKKTKNNLMRTIIILVCLLTPVFLLFHEQFIMYVIVPLAEYLRIGER
jgi:hypothetical protein